MKEKIKTQKGFIQIPLLVGIIVAVVITLVVGTGVVLHKQGKLTPLIANISQTFTETEEPITTQIEEAGQEELSEQLSAEEELMKSQLEQELEQARLEAERAKKEAEKIKLENERLKAEQETLRLMEARLKQEELSRLQEEAIKKAGQDSLLKIEKCKSEYNVRKSAMSAEIEKQLNAVSSLTQDIEKKSFEECISKGVEQLGIDFSTVSGQVFSSYVSLVKQACQGSLDESRKKALLKFDDLKKSEYNKLEQQLQQEYQQCLQK